jgi:hypothetical protein
VRIRPIFAIKKKFQIPGVYVQSVEYGPWGVAITGSIGGGMAQGQVAGAPAQKSALAKPAVRSATVWSVAGSWALAALAVAPDFIHEHQALLPAPWQKYTFLASILLQGAGALFARKGGVGAAREVAQDPAGAAAAAREVR